MKKRNRKIFVDLDGVAADFDKGCADSGLPPEEFKLQRGAYRHLAEVAGAMETLSWLEALGYDVFIATKIPHHNPYAATEKLLWLEERKPHLLKKCVITPHKGLLGDEHDYLIDDRPHKAHCDEFAGTLLPFGSGGSYRTWAAIREYFQGLEASGTTAWHASKFEARPLRN